MLPAPPHAAPRRPAPRFDGHPCRNEAGADRNRVGCRVASRGELTRDAYKVDLEVAIQQVWPFAQVLGA